MKAINKKGMTLVEVMIAMLLSLVIFLALMQTSLISIDQNMRSSLRDEAVRIAEMRMDQTRNILFTATTDNLTGSSDTGSLAGQGCPAVFTPTTGVIVNRPVRNIQNFTFCTNRAVTTAATDLRQVVITVGWTWKGQGYTHAVSSAIRRQ